MIVGRAVRRFGEARPVDAVPAAELRAWLLELRASLAPESIAGYVRGLKAFGNWCATEELAAAAGFRGLRRPKVPHRLIAPFSDPELRSLLALADERERALALVLLDTGLRLSELASLRVGDVRPDGTLHVMGKGAKERVVPIGASARRALVRYLATRAAVTAGDPLFCGLVFDLFSDNFQNWRGVSVELVDAPGLSISRSLTLGANTAQRWSVPIPEMTANVDYVLKWEVEIGVVMRAKIWRAVDPEPDWQISVQDPGNATFVGVDSSVVLASVMQTPIDQTKLVDYIRITQP